MTVRCAAIVIALSLALTTTATAQDAMNDAIFARVAKQQAAGKHQAAIKILDNFFVNQAWPPKARVMKGISLTATGKADAAFQLLSTMRKDASSEVKDATNEAGSQLEAQAVTIESTPAGATVVIDGQSNGSDGQFHKDTPSTVQLKPGYHTVTLSVAGHGDWSEEFFVSMTGGSVVATLTASTGIVTVNVDSEGLSVTLGSKKTQLAMGKNDISGIAVGNTTATFFDSTGKQVHEVAVTVGAAGTTVNYLVFGHVKTAWDDGTVQATLKNVDDKAKANKAKANKAASLKLNAGDYSVVLQRSGYYPVKSDLSVKAGETMTLSATSEKLADTSAYETWGYVGLGVGLTAVLAAAAMELAEIGEEGALDAVKFGLAGAGGAMFVTGGAFLRYSTQESRSPTPVDGTFDIKLGVAPTRNGAMIGAAGSF